MILHFTTTICRKPSCTNKKLLVSKKPQSCVSVTHRVPTWTIKKMRFLPPVCTRWRIPPTDCHTAESPYATDSSGSYPCSQKCTKPEKWEKPLWRPEEVNAILTPELGTQWSQRKSPNEASLQTASLKKKRANSLPSFNRVLAIFLKRIRWTYFPTFGGTTWVPANVFLAFIHKYWYE